MLYVSGGEGGAVSRFTVEQERIGEVGLDDPALRLGHLQSSHSFRFLVQGNRIKAKPLRCQLIRVSDLGLHTVDQTTVRETSNAEGLAFVCSWGLFVV